MMDFEFRGNKIFAGKVEKFADRYKEAVERGVTKAVLWIHQKLPDYPDRTGSSYRRTLLLGRSITTMSGGHPQALSRVESLGSEVKGIVGTAVEYAKYPIGDSEGEDQAWMHKGVWWVLYEEVRKLAKGIREIIEQEVHKILP